LQVSGAHQVSNPISKGLAIQGTHFAKGRAVIKNERSNMQLLTSTMFANVIWIGGGSVGVLLVIVVVMLLLCR
jgi:hypothetical protein